MLARYENDRWKDENADENADEKDEEDCVADDEVDDYDWEADMAEMRDYDEYMRSIGVRKGRGRCTW
jgi:hypothetical protein